jgi:photosystem II stability/assembly factor-like uncharacterized protein
MIKIICDFKKIKFDTIFKKAEVMLTITLLFPFITACDFPQLSWEKIHSHLNKEPIYKILISGHNLFYTTANSVFRLDISNIREEELIFFTSDISKTINDIHISENGKIAIAADNGTYISSDNGKSWQKSFYPTNQNLSCLSLSSFRSSLILGTSNGIYISDIDSDWERADIAFLQQEPIYKIITVNERIYVSTGESIFTVTKNKTVDRLFETDNSYIVEDACNEGPLEEFPDCPVKKTITDFFISENSMIVATDNGIFSSNNNGQSWTIIPSNNLPLKKLTKIILIPSDNGEKELFAATGEGCFVFKQNNWVPVYEGLSSSKIFDAISNSNDEILIATDDGVYRSQRNAISQEPLPDYEEIKQKFANEPSIRNAHAMAIEYADIHPTKIKRWHSLAAKKAWLPKFTVDFDIERNNTISNSIWGSYSNGGQLFIGPDDKTAYRNSGWGASFSWDLSELVWNPDQTSIDSRAKLMTEMREDLLSQISRIYFERRRLQIELIAGISYDPSDTLSKQMRVDELTALLDALTGGNFSKNISIE